MVSSRPWDCLYKGLYLAAQRVCVCVYIYIIYAVYHRKKQTIFFLAFFSPHPAYPLKASRVCSQRHKKKKARNATTTATTKGDSQHNKETTNLWTQLNKAHNVVPKHSPGHSVLPPLITLTSALIAHSHTVSTVSTATLTAPSPLSPAFPSHPQTQINRSRVTSCRLSSCVYIITN